MGGIRDFGCFKSNYVEEEHGYDCESIWCEKEHEHEKEKLFFILPLESIILDESWISNVYEKMMILNRFYFFCKWYYKFKFCVSLWCEIFCILMMGKRESEKRFRTEETFS